MAVANRAGLAPLLAAALAACAPRVHTGPAPLAVAVELVDSVPWEHEQGEGVLRRVQVRAGTRVDTVPRVLTSDLPIVVEGSWLLGLVYDGDAVVAGFRYDVNAAQLRLLPLPADLHSAFSGPSIAPDGKHIAYVAVPGDATGWGVVRSWPDGRPVLTTRRVQIPATDAPGHATRWLSADSAEIFVEIGEATGAAWHRVLVSARSKAILATDTAYAAPWEQAEEAPRHARATAGDPDLDAGAVAGCHRGAPSLVLHPLNQHRWRGRSRSGPPAAPNPPTMQGSTLCTRCASPRPPVCRLRPGGAVR